MQRNKNHPDPTAFKPGTFYVFLSQNNSVILVQSTNGKAASWRQKTPAVLKIKTHILVSTGGDLINSAPGKDNMCNTKSSFDL